MQPPDEASPFLRNVREGDPESVFASDYEIISNTGNARRFGSHDSVDTEEMSLRMFAELRRNCVIP